MAMPLARSFLHINYKLLGSNMTLLPVVDLNQAAK